MNPRLYFQSRGPLSLWDMLERYGHLIAQTVWSLTGAETIWNMPVRGTVAGSLSEHAVDLMDKRISAQNAIHRARQLRILTDWDALESQIVRLEGRVEWAPHHEVALEFGALKARITDDLANEFFFHLTPSDVPLYRNPEPFGSLVSGKFPKCIGDIEGAAKCLALQQSTAAVFHLMRVMEGAVTRLGDLLKVKLDPKKETWFNICKRASTAVTNRPAKNKPQAKRNTALAAAVAHLQTVRVAWRNEVMHPKETYSREEAHNVFNAVRVFMVDLAQLV